MNKKELKFKKKFPFIYVNNRPATEIEIIFDNAAKAQSLLIAVLPILIIAKIIYFLKTLHL